MTREERRKRQRRAVELYKAGYSLRAAGRKVGLSGEYVRALLRRAGVPTRAPSYHHGAIRLVANQYTYRSMIDFSKRPRMPWEKQDQVYQGRCYA